MRKSLFITILALLALSVPVKAQTYAIEQPKFGDMQFTLLLGSSNFSLYNETYGLSYLMPYGNYGLDDQSNIGFGSDPLVFLDLGSMNSNSIVNSIGIRYSYFVHKRFDVNVMFGMNINATPKKDFIEGDFEVPDMPIPNADYVVGRTNHMFYVQLGTNFYFLPDNPRISPYIGVVFGYQFARLETMLPYTGEEDAYGDPIELTTPSYQAGQSWAVQGGFVAGIDYSVAPGLILGVEVFPAMYQCSVMELHPSGMTPYRAINHDVKILTMPRLKLAFRF